MSKKKKFRELKHGDVIKPPKSYGWPEGLHVVVFAGIKICHVALWHDNTGIGYLKKSSWRSNMYVRSLDEAEMIEFEQFVEDKYGDGGEA